MKRHFSGLPDNRISGLLSELMTRIHNKGFCTAQMQVLLAGSNPNEYKVWRIQEWANFYSDLFDLSIKLDEFDHDYYKSGCMTQFNVETTGYDLTVLLDANRLPISRVIEVWNAIVPPSLAITLVGVKPSDLYSIAENDRRHGDNLRSTCLGHLKNRVEELQHIKMVSVSNGIAGSTLRGTLLELMQLYWKYGNMDIKKRIHVSGIYKIKDMETYILPCGDSCFAGSVDENNPSAPVIVLKDKRFISIYARGSKELLEQYQQQGCVLNLMQF